MFQAPATITKITTMRDRTLRLQVDTQELKPGASAAAFSLFEKCGVFAFDEMPIDESKIDIPDFIPTEKNDKTPSQRLRAVLFVYWGQSQKQQYEKFDDFYRYYMDKIIDHLKDKLI